MKVSKRHITIAAVSIAFLLAAAIPWALLHRKSPAADNAYKKEQLALIHRLLGKKAPVFLSPEYLLLAQEENGDLPASTPGKKETETALNDTAFFHSLHREKHFSAVLLAPGQASSPLCLTLLSSPVWTLTEVFPSGYLFQPAGAATWSPPDEETILRLHPDPDDRDRWVLGTAGNLIAIKRTKEADQLLLTAEKTHRFPSVLLSTKASLAASRGRWNDALSLSRQSLAKNSSNVSARVIMTRALIECGKTDEALSEAKKLRLLTGSRNTEALFLLARAANATNDKREEIMALRDLVSLARKNRQPLGASLTYLGQAYAQNGERGMAMRTFDEALAAPELTEEQREMIRQLITHLKPETPAQSDR